MIDNCPVCNTRGIHQYWVKGFDIRVCPDCQMLFVANQPDEYELRSLYDESFFSDGQKGLNTYQSSLSDHAAIRNAERRLRKIQRYQNTGSLLDVGCGTGLFLYSAKDYFATKGIDISSFSVAFGRQHFGLDVYEMSLRDAKATFGVESFDVITMWDVIEHVPNPLEFLGQGYELLKPGGIVAFTTGLVDSLAYRLTTSKWHLMGPPKHLSYFSTRSLEILLHKTGFQEEEFCRDGQFTNLTYMINKMSHLYKVRVPCFFTKIVANINIYVNLYDVILGIARKSVL